MSTTIKFLGTGRSLDFPCAFNGLMRELRIALDDFSGYTVDSKMITGFQNALEELKKKKLSKINKDNTNWKYGMTEDGDKLPEGELQAILKVHVEYTLGVLNEVRGALCFTCDSRDSGMFGS